MKMITIDNLTEPGESIHFAHLDYKVIFGNGKILRFRSRKAAEKSLADAGRFLTGQVISLNSDLSVLQLEYRRCWIYMRGRTEKSNSTYRTLQIKVSAALLEAANALDWVTGEFHNSNQQSFIWTKLIYTCKSLLVAAMALRDFRKKRMEMYERTIIEMLIENIKKNKIQIDTYGEIETQQNRQNFWEKIKK